MSCKYSKSVIFALLVFGISAQANASVMVGDIVRFQNGPGSPGGEFGIAHEATPDITEFATFCLEKNEYINFSDTFEVYDISQNADNGGVGGGPLDPVGEKTAWLYYNFRQGTLAGYENGDITDTSSSRVDAANALQNAVWFLEDEQNSAGVGASFVALADAEYDAFINDANYAGNMQTAIDLVRAMNIKWNSGSRKGQKAQSQLYLLDPPPGGGGSIPEPSTYIIWSLLMVGMIVVYKRQQGFSLAASSSC